MDIINHEFDAQTTPVYFSLALKRSYDIYMVYFLLFAICMACFDRPRSILRLQSGWQQHFLPDII